MHTLIGFEILKDLVLSGPCSVSLCSLIKIMTMYVFSRNVKRCEMQDLKYRLGYWYLTVQGVNYKNRD